MNDQPRRRRWVRLGVAAAVVAVVCYYAEPMYRRLRRPARLMYVSYNADRTYRMEVYEASGWQRTLHFSKYAPGFVRLVDNCKPARLTRQGPVVELDGGGNGQILWHEAMNGTVTVGRDTHFQNVPPLSRDCRVLPARRRADEP